MSFAARAASAARRKSGTERGLASSPLRSTARACSTELIERSSGTSVRRMSTLSGASFSAFS